MKPARRVLYGGAFVVLIPVCVALGTAVATAPLPDGATSAPGPLEWVGVIHVHTVASDGAGTLEEMTGAAGRLGLDFVILTDHNTRGAPAWEYYDSTLVVVGEEVNTPYGHLLVVGEDPVGSRLDLPAKEDAAQRGDTARREEATPGPPPAGSRPRKPVAVADDEGLRIAAHPTGRTRWKAWEPGHFDGIEIWNADTERRNDALGEWAHALALLPFRRMAALYRLLDYPSSDLTLWDRLTVHRPVFGVCSVDAHHTLPLNRSRTLDLHFPAYAHSFSLARQHVLLEAPPRGRPGADGHALLDALRRGRSYCGFDGLADARGARFAAVSGDARATLGETVEWAPGARMEIVLPPAGRNATVRLLHRGAVVDSQAGRRWSPSLPAPGVYRVEAFLEMGGRRVPWILTNPVRVVKDPDSAPAASTAR